MVLPWLGDPVSLEFLGFLSGEGSAVLMPSGVNQIMELTNVESRDGNREFAGV